MQTPGSDYISIVNTILIALVGGLIGWFAQDMRKRLSHVERRLGAIVRGVFYMVSHDRRAPEEARQALEEAMKEK
jgi:hypothetical protein